MRAVDLKNLRSIVAANIRRLAKRRRVGLNRLADEAGVSRSQLFNVLACTSAPSVGWLAAVAAALDVPAWKLLKGRGA